MRVAVISDIHGNFDALAAVLADIDKSKIDMVVCLGDCIGYGAEPERVIRTLQERGIPSTLGNHEQAVLERDRLDWFNPMAKASLIKTVSMLSEETLRMIKGFPTFLASNGSRFVHGFPPASVTTYSFELSPADKRRVLDNLVESVSFFGHTHDLCIITYDGHTLTDAPLGLEPIAILPDHRYAINVGSVGQPRDGNNNAKYVIWDKSDATFEVKFVPYDIAAAADKIIAAGLPEIHAKRLW
jgi:predicted phosphodiesterase